MLFRPTESSKRITDFYRRYLLTTFGTNNEKYNEQLKKALESEKAIADGPYISMSDPYEKGITLSELANEGIVSKEILKIENFHPDRKLYKHQEEAIRKAVDGKNLIVTTGTGSGKTESFLIPVINQLLQEKEQGSLDAGVRTLIIYPMNALVNDQIRRLRELLSEMDGDKKITFGKFTGETENSYEEALAKYREMEDLDKTPLCDNELICREQMRKTPPNILITNYAMLEYMLLRPGDNIIFSEINASKWQYIVFDEAHSYGGAKGIEVASLVKRVKAMLGRNDIKFILTSATLGDEKSDKEIVDFGEALCTAKFETSSIIRSHTVMAKPEHEIARLNYNLYRELAEQIRNNYSAKIIEETIKEYGLNVDPDSSLEEKFFDLVLHDEFYYDVRKVLYKKIKTVEAVARELSISPEDFTDFIAVASNAIRNNERLFEAKYHMFLRGIEGVFVTLNPSNKLFINKMETYKEKPFDASDIGYKVYEVSFCSNCNALFITGQESEGYLVQKSKYNDDYNPDVFLISGDFDEEDAEGEANNVYQICSKCGAIKRAASVNGLQCGHGKENITKIIKVKQSGEKLHKCPCCHSVNGQRSILRPYFLGTEAATAVIATALYSELPGVEHKITIEKIEDDFWGESENKVIDVQTDVTKQFLAFSDNRQTAAFFATYLESTYKDSLVKRIISQIVEENKDRFDKGIGLEYFVTLLSDKFEKNNIFPGENEERIISEAWIYTLKEISNFKAKNSLMKKGILMFDIEFNVPAPKGIDLSEEETADLFKILCKSILRDAAVSTEVQFTKADIERFTVTGSPKGYNKTSAGLSYVVGWSPEDGKTNKRLKYLTKVLGGDETKARGLLNSIWTYMCKNNYVALHPFGKRSAYILDYKKIKAKSVKKLYICSECKGVTPYNVKGICDNPRCNGHLVEYDYEKALREDHYHYLFTKLNITPMKVREHTAQLSSLRAYEYQRDFKNQKINVLSCSTTFEMGVDVGSLETVFMRNMPPSPANYAQRAGRAGRSLKSAAYALTFCPNSSHDLNYFKNPVAMIEGKINPPSFNVSNDKIVLRHIFASAFSHFWRVYPELYKEKIGEFIDADGFEKLREFLELKPESLRIYLNNIVPTELQNYFDVENYGWLKYLFNTSNADKGLCNIVVDKYKEDIIGLEKERARRIEKGYKSDTILYSIRTIKDQRIIDFLSKNNLIPKYGFPVDTVELQSSSTGKTELLSLNRDLFSAISEYAPESEVVADGLLLKSRYVRRLVGYEWPKYNYAVCPECLTLNRTSYVSSITECRQCGKTIRGRERQYIIPKFGFLLDTVDPKPVGLNKPERTYKGSISYIGDENKIDFHEYKINEHRILLGNSKMDSLAVLNESSFFICDACGYGTIDEETSDSVISLKHVNSNGHPCGNEKLRRYALGHEFQTDVVLIKFVDFNVTKVDEAWTILYAMLEGLSRNMCIDRNELSGCLQWYRNAENNIGNFGFVLFDNTPGGAGYVRQLAEPQNLSNMLREAFRIVSNCSCGGEDGDTACYSCLCNYYNQRQHDVLKRKYAIEFFKQISLSYDVLWDCLKNDEIYVGATIEESVESKEQESLKEYYQLSFCNNGRNQMSDSVEEIWTDLLDDCDDTEAEIIRRIMNSSCNNISKPIYGESIRIIETGEVFYVRQLWKEKNVMLFLKDDMEDCEIAKKTGWHCYSTTEDFDVEEFIKRIEV